ncbi:hypothetical protein TWF506_004433 [Arthrobotrys conoides]|uniref:Uncharacterized protein n=1 Tax=Arthrobotrys conoides TaxID=74498 RepID=A0AAN8NK17_9PEZI
MCHRIYTFSQCYHIDISDDEKHFPPCRCRRIRGTRHLERACNGCIRFCSPAFPREHKKAINQQVFRFKSLQLTHEDIKKYLPDWKRIVGVGTKVLGDSPDDIRETFYDGFLDEKILDAIEEEIRNLDDENIATKSHPINEKDGATREETGHTPSKGSLLVGPTMEQSGNLGDFIK